MKILTKGLIAILATLILVNVLFFYMENPPPPDLRAGQDARISRYELCRSDNPKELCDGNR